jgi:formylglycine-generating enzyme required for sulfatase activity
MSLRAVRLAFFLAVPSIALATVSISRTSPPEGGVPAILTDLERWDRSAPPERLAAAEEVEALAPGFVFDRMEVFGPARREVALFVHESTGIEFALVPAGSFTQGAVPDPVWTGDPRSPGPPHRVTLTEPFLLARTEVRQPEFERVMGSNPSHFRGAWLPVDSVTWGEAAEFCRRTGLELPTEAHWERAARAGAEGCGDLQGWTKANSGGTTHEVSSVPPDCMGLFDVRGNVWEWMADTLAPYGGGDEVDPRGPEAPSGWRVVRSGAWSHDPVRAEPSARCGAPEDERLSFFGFRPLAVIRAR